MRAFFSQKAARSFALPLLCFVLALAGFSGRAEAVSSVSARLRPDMSIVIDGSARDFYNAAGQEVHPILCDGTTYLPVRAIGELMAKNVDWNQSTKTVTLSGRRGTAAVAGTPDTAAEAVDVAAEIRDDFTVIVDGTKRTFADASGKTVYPLLYNGSTYLPVRAIGELMGKSVAWDGATSTVTLSGSLVTDADSFSGGTDPAAAPAFTGADGAPLPTVISREQAREIALAEVPGAVESDVTKLKTDIEDGKPVYEVEIVRNGAEYDFEIDAQTGEIRKSDYETGKGAPIAPAAGGDIGRDKAQAIALAQVPGADASHVRKLKTDRDDGQLVYEVEIVCGGIEYDFEIDAASGTILEMDSEKAD